MKIRKLTIKNIASIADATLDFESEALRNESLFLICGETGAGKTTILDAITLALYGKTPRYADKKSKTDVEVGGFAFNDPRQLVRRGATSARATLTLCGNDGREYEASWSVEANQRGRNKGLLKDDAWTWKDLSPSGLEYTKVGECNEIAKRAVGLAFEQFCRTSLLAQGQFTKFLLGTEDEKAEILEKLTDTSGYKVLGQRIAEKYGALVTDVKQREAGLAALTGLGERRAEVETRIAAIKDQLVSVEVRTKSAERRREWLRRKREQTALERQVRDGLTADVAALKFAMARRAEERDVAVDELAKARQTLAAQVDRAPMLEAADVILAALDDAKASRRREVLEQRQLDELRQRLPDCKASVAAAQKQLENAVQNATAKGGELELAEHRLEAIGMAQLRKLQAEGQRRQGDLKVLKATLETLAGQKTALAQQEAALKVRKEELTQNESGLPELERNAQTARAAAEKARAERDRQKALIDDGIRKVVAELKAGEICPICGNRIEHLHGEAYFSELIGGLNESCRTAEKESERQMDKLNVLKATIAAMRKAIADKEVQVSGVRREIARMAVEADGGARTLGLPAATAEAVAAAQTTGLAELKEVGEKLVAGERQEQLIRQLQNEVKNLDKAVAKAKDELAKAQLACQQCEGDILHRQTAVKTEGERAVQKLAAAAEKIVLPDWEACWQRDPTAFEERLAGESRNHRELKAAIPGREAAARDLEKECRQMADCIGRAVAAWPALAETPAADEARGIAVAAVDGRIGMLKSQIETRERHSAERPGELLETDTEAALAIDLAKAKETVEGLQQEKGRLEQQISDDDRLAEERKVKEDELTTLRAERDEWSVLHDLFGDKEGRKIQREIQTYVLANVLTKANHYLRQLTDRYELSCEGLTLTVNDAYEGGVTRPVNTLSGGEGFLVSLALALGLAGMNEQGLSVDMLFIDEGFGTLSGEHLNAALEALERLNAVCGSRKVGVISHVERLRERIRTHVEVSRSGYDPATVQVTQRTVRR